MTELEALRAGNLLLAADLAEARAESAYFRAQMMTLNVALTKVSEVAVDARKAMVSLKVARPVIS